MPSPHNYANRRDDHKGGGTADFLTLKIQGGRGESDASSGYYLSFTAASLRPELARIVAEGFLAVGDWDLVKKRVLSTNSLQCRSANSAIRLERELRQRIETLTHEQMILLVQAAAEERAAIAWLAACKRIRFAFEFAAEVLRDKLAVHDPVLRPF